MSSHLVDPSRIPGWGIDADPQNDPTYPIRHSEDLHSYGLDWDRPALQQPGVEILQSVEHLRRPAVVGTSTPPTALSGVIRRIAFQRSESDWWHWLMLMGADRIGVVEGVVADLAGGRVPNIPAEMGIRAEWRHNKPGLAKKAAVALAVSAGIYAFVRLRRTSDAVPAAAEPIGSPTRRRSR